MLLQCHLQRSYCIGVHRSWWAVTQELSHRSSYIGVNSQVIYLYLNSYKTPTSQVSLFFSYGAGRLRLAKRDSLRRMCVSDAQTRGEMRILFVLEQPAVEIARRTPKCVAKCEFHCPWRRPLARNEGGSSKTGVNLQFWNFRCNLFARNEGQGPKLGSVKLWFRNLRCNAFARNQGQTATIVILQRHKATLWQGFSA